MGFKVFLYGFPLVKTFTLIKIILIINIFVNKRVLIFSLEKVGKNKKESAENLHSQPQYAFK